MPEHSNLDDAADRVRSAGLACVLVLDGAGRVLEADGFAVSPQPIAELLPQLPAAAFANWRTALDSTPGAVLRLELAGAGGGLALVLRPEPGAPARYRMEVGDGGSGGDYRERLEHRLAFERLIAALSTELIHAPAARLDVLIEQSLGRIGRMFGVDRAYLFRFDPAGEFMANTHEWVEEGVSREAHNLQQVPMMHFGWLMGELLAGRSVHIPAVAELPPQAIVEREEFEREGIRSLVMVPFGDSAAPEGFIGFDSVRRERHWPPDILLGLRLVGQMFFNAFRAQEMAERLTRLAFHDPLTGLGNRRLLAERLGYALERSRREGGRLAVLLIDLDDFKLVNDSYGHSLGDEMLKTAAARLCGSVRGNDMVARLGGDEFVVVAEVAGLEPLSRLIERLFETMREPIESGSVAFAPRMSVGISLFPEDGADAEALLRQADTAMYVAKSSGKNRFAFFAEEMTRASRTALRLRHELRLAVDRGEIRPYYQPRVELPSRRVIGFEALARWHHPERGLLLPADFLELAGSSGLIGRLDLDIMARAIADLGIWRTLHPGCRVSVNLDASDLHDEEMLQRLLPMLGSIDADGLEIEITETSLMRDIERNSHTLARLREVAPALRIAIDDFGSRYSSLAYLGRLPVTTLKIDRGFVADLAGENRRNARAIIHSILDLGTSLGLHVVAEGVETADQADELAELGCSEAQGFLFAPGVPPAEATALLEGHRLIQV